MARKHELQMSSRLDSVLLNLKPYKRAEAVKVIHMTENIGECRALRGEHSLARASPCRK